MKLFYLCFVISRSRSVDRFWSLQGINRGRVNDAHILWDNRIYVSYFETLPSIGMRNVITLLLNIKIMSSKHLNKAPCSEMGDKT